MLKYLLTVLFLFTLFGLRAYAQTENFPDKLPDDLNQEQWEAIRDLYAVDAIKLLAKLDTINLEIDSLKNVNNYYEKLDCEAELLAIIGATREQVSVFRIKFDEAEGKIKGNNGAPDDASMRIMEEIRMSKIKCLPEFNDRFSSLNKLIANYKPTDNTTETKGMYSVVKGDCLWKISSRSYSTPYLWPAIWEANRSEIFDPNFIYPGEVLKIPLINDEDRKKAVERSKHYRKKRKTQNNL
ncbi:MAG: LysM peptidoglycan-binding domain-containing protein [Ignavibacteria bacterium]